MNRVGQTWTNMCDFYLIVSSVEARPTLWMHQLACLESADTSFIEESSRVDWSCKDLSYWQQVL